MGLVVRCETAIVDNVFGAAVSVQKVAGRTAEVPGVQSVPVRLTVDDDRQVLGPVPLAVGGALEIEAKRAVPAVRHLVETVVADPVGGHCRLAETVLIVKPWSVQSTTRTVSELH